MKKLSFLIVGVVTLISNDVIGQSSSNPITNPHSVTVTIPEVAKLSLVSSSASNISLAFTHPTDPGSSLESPAANEDIWMNYSSIASAADPTRTIKVDLSLFNGTTYVPYTITGGVSLFVSSLTNVGVGTLGNAVPFVAIAGTPTNFITGITSCYTGVGVNFGRKLSYAVVVAPGAYGSIRASSQTYRVTYTLTDN